MNFFGSIVPTVSGCQYQALGWASFFQVVQNLLNFAVYLAIFFAVLIFAYAGFLWVTNPANPGNKEKGREALMNGVIGLVVVLGAWLIINTIIVALGAGSLGSLTGVFTGGDPCVSFSAAPPATSNSGLTGSTPPASGGASAVQYVGDAVAEVRDESGLLSNMLSCMAGKATFEVTSISDHLITPDGTKTFAQCAAGGQTVGCAHTAHSCHYGGVSCVGQSYAADIRNQSDNAPIIAAAQACGSTWQGPEADHLHISIGKTCGCN